MKSHMTRLLLTICLFAGLAASSTFADLGLQQTLSDEGPAAVGNAVKTAMEAIYASTDDEESIKSQITTIMNEAAAIGDGEAVRYAIVAVMMAGGFDNLDLSKEAIDNSAAFADFPAVTAFTVSAMETFLSASDDEPGGGKNGESGGGGKSGGGNNGQSGGNGNNGQSGGGDNDNEQGGGGDNDNEQGGGGDNDNEQGGGGDNDDEQGGGDDDNPLDDGDDSDIDDGDTDATPI